MRKRIYLMVGAVCAVVTLVGCGFFNSPRNRDIEGAWNSNGSSTTNSYAATQIVVLDDGSLWGIYGFNATSLTGIQGMLHGSAKMRSYCNDPSDDDEDDQDDCDDQEWYPSPAGELTQFDMSGGGSQNAGFGFLGSVKKSPQATTLDITLDGVTELALVNNQNYWNAASLSAIAGTYTGWSAVSGQPRHDLDRITVSGSTLTLPADTNGCSATGTLNPHQGSTDDGATGVFDVSLTFNGSGCTFGNGTTVKGIVIPGSILGNNFPQLAVVTVTSDGQNGFMVVANPQ